MAQLQNIRITNYKGIEDLTIEIESPKNPGRFITMIGLNESGKTTILEAMSHSSLSDSDTSDLMESIQGDPELNDLIPKKHKAAFTGVVSIRARVMLSSGDINKIDSFIKNEFGYKTIRPLSPILDIDKQYTFEDSSCTKQTNLWTFGPEVRKIRGSKIISFDSIHHRSEWTKTVEFIRSLLPRIIYFPTFLVQFPSRIYLEGNHGQTDQYYRDVINDVLCCLPHPLSIDKHIIERIDKHRKPSTPFSSALRSAPEGQQIDATVQALSGELNRVIFGAWSDIFGKKIKNRRINVEWHIDEDNDRHVYLEFYISAGSSRFYISERSLGFRWFFSFLLFTQFRSFRSSDNKVIFLFDEPASHLHAKAQSRLLESFSKIADPDHLIIYSTHSHYLINPLWLEKAYIITNASLDADSDDPNIELNDSDTAIDAIKYPKFVSENPTKLTYFQPALDSLDYRQSPTLIGERSVLFEGKSDFYAFSYFMNKLNLQDLFLPFPATGSGTMGALVALMRGWGVPFLILLDDDAAGRKERDRYRKLLLLREDEALTFGDLDKSLAGNALEGLLQDDVVSAMQACGFSSRKKPKKEEFFAFFQKLISDKKLDIHLNKTGILFESLIRQASMKLNENK